MFIEKSSSSQSSSMQNNSSNITKMVNDSYSATDQNTSSYTNMTNITSITTTNNQTCYTDPMAIQTIEWQAYLREDDPSIPRTYNLCPNSTIHVYKLNPMNQGYDFTSGGDAFPLMLFRSNINILCGFQEPYYDNNCTWSGGFFHITIEKQPFFVDDGDVINSTAQNITIDGFRFTKAEFGFNIGVRNYNSEGLTIKNCVFEENFYVEGNINMAHSDTQNASLTVENCVFRNNELFYKKFKTFQKGKLTSIPVAGVIYAFPSFPYKYERDTTLKVSIADSIFQNNTFLLEDSKYREQFTGAIINLPVPYLTHLEVTNTCFIGNTEYTSLILMLSDIEDVEHAETRKLPTLKLNSQPTSYNTTVTNDEDQYKSTILTPSIVFSGNTFLENKPHEIYYSTSSTTTSLLSSCILGHQIISYEDTLPINSTFDIETDCLEYYDSSNKTQLSSAENTMCLAFA